MTVWDFFNELLSNLLVRTVFLILAVGVVIVLGYAILVQKQPLSLGPLKIGGELEDEKRRKKSYTAIKPDRKAADLPQTRPPEISPGVKRVTDNDLDNGIKMGGQYRDPPQNLELLSSDWARWGKGWVKSGWFYNPPDSDLSHAVAFFKIHLWDRGDAYVHILSASNTEQTIWLETDAGFRKDGKFKWDNPDLRTDFWDKIKWK